MKTVIAVDVGGTKLAAAIVDRDGRIVERARAATPETRDPEVLFAALAAVVDALPRPSRARAREACGVGSGGPMRDGGALVSPVNIPAWRDFPLRDRLRAQTGVPTWVDNDAKALALGEGWLGAAAGERNYIAMVVSTGIGGGIVLDGAPARRRRRQRGPHRSRDRRTRRAALRLRRAGLRGSRGVGHRDPGRSPARHPSTRRRS